MRCAKSNGGGSKYDPPTNNFAIQWGGWRLPVGGWTPRQIDHWFRPICKPRTVAPFSHRLTSTAARVSCCEVFASSKLSSTVPYCLSTFSIAGVLINHLVAHNGFILAVDESPSAWYSFEGLSILQKWSVEAPQILQPRHCISDTNWCWWNMLSNWGAFQIIYVALQYQVDKSGN